MILHKILECTSAFVLVLLFGVPKLNAHYAHVSLQKHSARLLGCASSRQSVYVFHSALIIHGLNCLYIVHTFADARVESPERMGTYYMTTKLQTKRQFCFLRNVINFFPSLSVTLLSFHLFLFIFCLLYLRTKF